MTERMDVVVRLSGHAENASNALQSVLNNHASYSHVHLVCSFYEADKEPFEGYEALRAELGNRGIKVTVCDAFDEDNCTDVKSYSVVGLHPYCVLRSGGVGKITSTIGELEKQKNTQVMHCGVSTTMVIPEGAFGKDLWDALCGYGFLLITFYLDMWWRVWSRGKHYMMTDVRVDMVCSTYKRKFIPRVSRFARIWDNEQAPCNYGGDAAILRPEPKMRGFALARYLVNTHNKQVFGGLWMFVFFAFFYYWLAYPWWNLLAIPGASSFLARPVLAPLNIIIYLLTTGTLYMSSSYYLILPHQGLLCALFPIYMTLYPLFWLYARLYRPKDTWNAR